MIASLAVELTENWSEHSHEIHELIVCHGEGGELCIDGMRFPFRKGKIFLIQAGRLHSFELLDKSSVTLSIICFDDGFLDKCISPSILRHKKTLFENGYNIDNENTFFDAENIENAGRIYEIAREKEVYYEELAGGLLSVLLLKYLRYIKHQQQVMSDVHEKKINLTLEWIDQHLSDRITIDDAASTAGMSRSVFTRYFKQKTTMSLTQYLSTTRISRSASLLSIGEHSITEVAYQSGFHNLGNFYKQFNQQYSMTPNQFRKMLMVQ